MEEEHSRINKRLELLEESSEKLNALNTSIEKLAVSMEGMLKEQIAQGQRLEVLEKRDGENWRKLIWVSPPRICQAGRPWAACSCRRCLTRMFWCW